MNLHCMFIWFTPTKCCFICFFCERAADGIKIINQLDDDVFTTVIKYVHKNMSLSDEHADVDDDGGLEK